MLIDFTFENYLSFKNRATISFVIPGDKEAKYTRYVLEVENGKYLLSPFAAIYGQNAAGKSNVIKALMDFVNLVLYSHTLGIDAPIPSYKPNKLDVSCRSAPVLFEAEFLVDEIRYLLKVLFDRNSILQEELIYYPQGRKALLYSRKQGEPIHFGSSFKGTKKGLEQFLRPNALFLSTAVNLSNEQLRPLYKYFQTKYRFHVAMDSSEHPIIGTTLTLLAEKPIKRDTYKKAILSFLNAADISVTDVVIKKDEALLKDFVFPPDIPQQVKDRFIESLVNKPFLAHTLYNGSESMGEDVLFDLGKEESGGTIKMYELAGEIIDSLKTGGVLLIDEFNSGLHPQLCEFIVALFRDRTINTKGAQLIVTSHDTNLMARDDIYRDELWLVDRDSYGASELYSINDFSKNEVRKGTNLEKWYLDGRFKAVPSINPSALILESAE